MLFLTNNQFKFFLFFSLIIIASTTAYLIYSRPFSSLNEIVIIYPDESPTKIKPQETGGLVMPNSDNTIYESLQRSKPLIRKINILPEPEAPINISTKNPTVPVDHIDAILAKVLMEETKTSNDKDQELKPVSELTITETELLDELEALMPKVNRKLNIIKIAEKTDKLEPTTRTKRLNLSHYKIQLGSVKSEMEGIQAGERIKKKYAKILDNPTISLKKIEDSKGHFFYLVIAANHYTISQAKNICKKLSAAQQECIITQDYN